MTSCIDRTLFFAQDERIIKKL